VPVAHKRVKIKDKIKKKKMSEKDVVVVNVPLPFDLNMALEKEISERRAKKERASKAGIILEILKIFAPEHLGK
jgi:hypothetical protein